MIAKIANSTKQSTPMLIPSDGSSFACRSERRSPGMATLLVIEDVPTLAQPTRVECGAVHMKEKMPAAIFGGMDDVRTKHLRADTSPAARQPFGFKIVVAYKSIVATKISITV